MTVWQLLLKLLRHALHGRGGDQVNLYHADDFGTGLFNELPCHQKDFWLVGVDWSPDADGYFVLEGRPTREQL